MLQYGSLTAWTSPVGTCRACPKCLLPPCFLFTHPQAVRSTIEFFICMVNPRHVVCKMCRFNNRRRSSRNMYRVASQCHSLRAQQGPRERLSRERSETCPPLRGIQCCLSSVAHASGAGTGRARGGRQSRPRSRVPAP